MTGKGGGKRLSRKDINAIRDAFLSGERRSDVEKRFKISPVTFDRHRKNEGWDDLKKRAEQKAKAKIVLTAADRIIRDMNVLDYAKSSMARDLQNRVKAGEELRYEPHGWNEIDKAQALIEGRPTSKEEHVHSIGGDGHRELDAENIRILREFAAKAGKNGLEDVLAKGSHEEPERD